MPKNMAAINCLQCMLIFSTTLMRLAPRWSDISLPLDITVLRRLFVSLGGQPHCCNSPY